MLAELWRKRGHLPRTFHAHAISHCCGKRSYLRRSHGDALISVHAGQCQEAFHLIDAAHGRGRRILGNQGAVFTLHQRATRGPSACIGNAVQILVEEIAIKTENHICLIKLWVYATRRTKRRGGASKRCIVIHCAP